MPISDLTGTTWVFNSVLTDLYAASFNIDFTNNGNNYDYLEVYYDDFAEVYTIFYGQYAVYDDDGGGHWFADNYKTITITGGIDATEPLLIQWLESNATQETPPQPTANNMFFGSLPISKVFLGSVEVSKLFLNDMEIYGEAGSTEPASSRLPSGY